MRTRVRGYSPRRAYVAQNFGAMRCSGCCCLLNEAEIAAQWRMRLIEPLCFACRGYSRRPAEIDIDGPKGVPLR